jgi:hypothetical protein
MSSKVDDRAELEGRFARFAEEARGSSALYTALSPAIAGCAELIEIVLAAPPTQRRPNLLFAAVHDLLLAGLPHPLRRYYPSVVGEAAVPADDGTLAAFRDLCAAHRKDLEETVAARRTQTNEVRRSVALLPVLQQLSAARPVALLEVGASAGLNLLVDRFRYRYGDGPWIGDAGSAVAIECAARGALPLRSGLPRIAWRVGLDSMPLDVTREEDARWLMACVWPDQLHRLGLLRAAIAVAGAGPPRIVKGDAVEDLEALLAEAPADLPTCVFHSATAAYFTDEQSEAFVAALERAARGRALHWVSLEGTPGQTFGSKLPFGRLYSPRPGDRPTDPFGLLGYARWVDGARRDRLLARVDMHGREIEWLDSSFGAEPV